MKGLQRQVREVQTIMENNIQIVCPPHELPRIATLHARDLQVSAPILREVLPALRRCRCRYAGRKHTDKPPWLLRCDVQARVCRRPALRLTFKVLRRLWQGWSVQDLQDRTADMNTSADEFRRKTVALRRRMYWQNKNWWIIVFFLIIIVLLIIFLSVCFKGGNCFK